MLLAFLITQKGLTEMQACSHTHVVRPAASFNPRTAEMKMKLDMSKIEFITPSNLTQRLRRLCHMAAARKQAFALDLTPVELSGAVSVGYNLRSAAVIAGSASSFGTLWV